MTVLAVTPPPYSESHFKETAASLPHVAKYSFQDYRHTLEDSVRDILAADLHLPLSYKWTDLRLVLGYTSALLGLGATGYAHLTGFAATKTLITYTVGVYVLLSVATSVILMVYESKYLAEATLPGGGDKKGQGHGRAGTRVTVATSITDAAEWQVEVHVTTTNKTGKQRKAVVAQVWSFGEYFTDKGQVVGEKVYDDVCGWMREAQTQLTK